MIGMSVFSIYLGGDVDHILTDGCMPDEDQGAHAQDLLGLSP